MFIFPNFLINFIGLYCCYMYVLFKAKPGDYVHDLHELTASENLNMSDAFPDTAYFHMLTALNSVEI